MNKFGDSVKSVLGSTQREKKEACKEYAKKYSLNYEVSWRQTLAAYLLKKGSDEVMW